MLVLMEGEGEFDNESFGGGGEGKNLRTTTTFSFKFLQAKKIDDPSRVTRRERARREKISVQPLYWVSGLLGFLGF